MNSRLTCLHKECGSYVRATGVTPGQHVGRGVSLVVFDGRPHPSSSVLASSLSPTTTPPSVVTNSNEIGARNGVAIMRAVDFVLCVFGGRTIGSDCTLEPILFPPMSSVLGDVLNPDAKSMCQALTLTWLHSSFRRLHVCRRKQTQK